MGYFLNEKIASVAEPTQTTLANSPNFVVFTDINKELEGERFRASLRVLSFGKLELETQIVVIENPSTGSRKTHLFKSTYDPKKVSDDTFLMLTTNSRLLGSTQTMSEEDALRLSAQNIKECLSKNAYLRSNFEITLGLEDLRLNNDLSENNSIQITSKGCGDQYQVIIYTQVVDSKNVKGNDFTISLKNLDYANLDISKLNFKMLGHSLRVGHMIPIVGTDTVTHDLQFEVVLPNAILSEDEAKLQTLANIYFVITNIDLVQASLNVDLDVEDLSIYLVYKDGYVGNGFDSGIDDVVSEYEMLEVRKKVDDLPKIKMEYIYHPHSYDTIDYGSGNYQIALDVYTDHGQSRNMNESQLKLGKYVTTLSKSYFGRPLWFDINTLLSKKVHYSADFLTVFDKDNAPSWCNAGTVTDYRFVAKRTNGTINEAFFYSSPLFVVNGYNYTLEPLALEESTDGGAYIIDFDPYYFKREFVKLKPLTTHFARTHIKGQKQYINFMHNYRNEDPSTISVHYKLYTQMGTFVGEVTKQHQHEDDLYQINTTLLQLDQFLPQYNSKTVGRIDVYLSYKVDNDVEVDISIPMSFSILPEVLNTVNDFAFLNQLGGWDSVNFGGDTSFEFKATPDTIYKTLQPDFSLQTEIESVASRKIKEQKVAKTSPISKENILWLRQMSASPAVYELSSKRYILIDDMALKYNSTDDLYVVEMKYHYTDTFNTLVSK